MNKPLLVAASTAPLLVACAAQTQWSTQDALSSESVEVQVDEGGAPLEIEYHVDASMLPADVRAKMHLLHPGGLVTGAEKEYHGDVVYWEMQKTIVGKEVEALFRADGTLVSEEVQVDAQDVPQAVREAVARRMDGTVTAWEEIRDGDRELTSYHAKVASAGKRYKVAVSPSGSVKSVVRELAAEIEVPVR